MAIHIQSVTGSSIPKVDKDQFYSTCRTGDLVFCSGQADISKTIEKETNSPFSHVLQLWLPSGATEWLTLESTINHGVHVGRFTEYIDKYDGNLVLTRRENLSAEAIIAIRNKFFTILDDQYDWKTEVGIVAHKLLAAVKVPNPKKEYYCSGAQQFASTAWLPVLQNPNPLWMATPEDNWTDPTVTPICAFIRK